MKKQTIDDLNQQIENLKQKVSDLESEKQKADMKIFALEIKWQYEQAVNKQLLKEREEAAEMANKLNGLLNKKEAAKEN